MTKRKPKGDVNYYVKDKKKPVAYSTVATSDYLSVMHEDYPNANILELKDIILSGKFIIDYEAVEVLDKFIEKNYGNIIPMFKSSWE